MPLDYYLWDRMKTLVYETKADSREALRDHIFAGAEHIRHHPCNIASATQSLMMLHERPLHASKVTVWCAVSSHGVIGPYFFENEDRITVTVTSDRYVEMLQTSVAPALKNFPQLHETWFQQDGATSHTARQSIAAVRELFGNRVISRFGDIPWPPRSPDLSDCDFSLWGYLKSRVYTTRPRTLDELKQRIEEEIRGIPAEMLQPSVGNLNNRLGECIRRQGSHLQDVIFRD
ncbi:hypothetical protein B7P43_G09194 [Cryptotermes secundus]|uniref:Tc1-like transposase DDE domain-containing protein n=1 Tax=Cryptotermes secundus TaxID=105785 RepID=A0A2J7QGS3_9NEOP|nr:hypothetical protein B7P43_G09194 [Cryptotermes secundus]